MCYSGFSRKFWEIHHQSGHPKSCALSLHSARKGLLSSSMQWKSLWSELRCEHSQLSASGCSEGGWESGWESTQLQLAPTKGWWPVVGNPVKSLAKSLKSEQAGRRKKSQCGLRPLKMEIHLPSVPLMKIFSYLDAYSLLQVAQVNKVKAPWLNSSIRCTQHEALWPFPLSLAVLDTPASHSHSLPSFFPPSFLSSFPP